MKVLRDMKSFRDNKKFCENFRKIFERLYSMIFVEVSKLHISKQVKLYCGLLQSLITLT